MTEGLADPANINQQKENYVRNLDEQLKTGASALEEQVRGQKSNVREQAEQQKAVFAAQVDQAVRMQEMQVEHQHAKQVTELKKQAVRQRSQLEHQALALSHEFQEKMYEEDMHHAHYSLHQESRSLQEKMRSMPTFGPITSMPMLTSPVAIGIMTPSGSRTPAMASSISVPSHTAAPCPSRPHSYIPAATTMGTVPMVYAAPALYTPTPSYVPSISRVGSVALAPNSMRMLPVHATAQGYYGGYVGTCATLPMSTAVPTMMTVPTMSLPTQAVWSEGYTDVGVAA